MRLKGSTAVDPYLRSDCKIEVRVSVGGAFFPPGQTIPKPPLIVRRLLRIEKIVDIRKKVSHVLGLLVPFVFFLWPTLIGFCVFSSRFPNLLVAAQIFHSVSKCDDVKVF